MVIFSLRVFQGFHYGSWGKYYHLIVVEDNESVLIYFAIVVSSLFYELS